MKRQHTMILCGLVIMVLLVGSLIAYAEKRKTKENGSPVSGIEKQVKADKNREDGEFKIGENGDRSYYKDGIQVKGWQEIKGATYYFGPKTGKMLTGFSRINGEDYYFGKQTGHLYKGFAQIDGETYYFGNKTGKMYKGFTTIKNHKYYFGKSSGRMYTGLHRIKNDVYTFDKKGRLVRTVYGDKKAVCLTYDDGPSVNTRRILKTIKDNDGLATFFIVGNRLHHYPETFKEVIRSGSQIGNHTYSHPWLSGLSEKDIRTQIKKTNRLIKKYGGNPTVCRTPGGQLGDKIKKNVNMPIILWSIDTRDWATRDTKSTYDTVLDHVKDGSVILMHDLYRPTADATVNFVPKLKEKGFQMVTIDEMALLKRVKLKEGRVYYSFAG